LQLVEELLKPGARQSLGEEDRGSGTATPNGKARPTEELLRSSNNELQRAKKGAITPKKNYLPSARLTVTAAKGKDRKKIIDISDVIGSNEDIERRLQEQLERPKAFFSEDGPVRETSQFPIEADPPWSGLWNRRFSHMCTP